MLRTLRQWRRQRSIERMRPGDDLWRELLQRVAFLAELPAADLERLRDLTALFLDQKAIHGAGGYEPDDATRLVIAAQACLPVLNLGLDCYSAWVEVIVYPDEFVPDREHVDEAGVVHRVREPLAGESWLQGPVILSAADVDPAWSEDWAVNVVIHEFAHKLDMLNGDANGQPPLHAGMDREAWRAAFAAAYRDLQRRARHRLPTAIDSYAAESPGEFFAVASEAFFQTPRALQAAYPAVYAQLAAFYRQDPAQRAVAAAEGGP
ncbi:MAG: zinc-dependent peptidase [Pseudomonadota bacterium]